MEKIKNLFLIKNNNGFSLVELMMVVLVMAVLTGIAIPTYTGLRDSARESATESDMNSIAKALELFRNNNPDYPATEQGIKILEENELKVIPEEDHWGNLYIYSMADSAYELRSMGRDETANNDDDIVFTNGAMVEDGAFAKKETLQPKEPLTSLGNTYLEITGSIISLINDFYEENERYPRSWGDYVFTDIGLDPEEWQQAYDHIIYSPVGNRVSIKPEEGYAFDVDDLDGNSRTLSYSYRWSLVYSMENETWYYHTIAEGNEININSLTVFKILN